MLPEHPYDLTKIQFQSEGFKTTFYPRLCDFSVFLCGRWINQSGQFRVLMGTKNNGGKTLMHSYFSQGFAL